jgi:hypothetical protein
VINLDSAKSARAGGVTSQNQTGESSGAADLPEGEEPGSNILQGARAIKRIRTQFRVQPWSMQENPQISAGGNRTRWAVAMRAHGGP